MRLTNSSAKRSTNDDEIGKVHIFQKSNSTNPPFNLSTVIELSPRSNLHNIIHGRLPKNRSMMTDHIAGNRSRTRTIRSNNSERERERTSGTRDQRSEPQSRQRTAYAPAIPRSRRGESTRGPPFGSESVLDGAGSRGVLGEAGIAREVGGCTRPEGRSEGQLVRASKETCDEDATGESVLRRGRSSLARDAFPPHVVWRQQRGRAESVQRETEG